ncbi:hypothetical protein EVAR_55410_1 [Eumeta japonica]|uniref:Uncharacterized protein n=1 Tax=Eumeta variegata TaxID=151549 RepID=A0A4C1YTX5_EUMVA|nr:hypothetical protein EVAR_55410_1 [Eumeta japonica]
METLFIETFPERNVSELTKLAGIGAPPPCRDDARLDSRMTFYELKGEQCHSEITCENQIDTDSRCSPPPGRINLIVGVFATFLRVRPPATGALMAPAAEKYRRPPARADKPPLFITLSYINGYLLAPHDLSPLLVSVTGKQQNIVSPARYR